MNYLLISAEKKNNKIHLICENITIEFEIFEHDTIESIINDMKYENLIITNIKFFMLAINIFLKPNNRIYKIS